MTVRVAINGYGRIGRNILRALYESKRTDIQIVVINDLGDVRTSAHLTQFDTTHGRFSETVNVQENYLVINGDEIWCLAERSPEKLPWADLQIDVVMECTGHFTGKAKAAAHL